MPRWEGAAVIRGETNADKPARLPCGKVTGYMATKVEPWSELVIGISG